MGCKILYENITEYVSTLLIFTSEVWSFSSETNMSRPVTRVGDFHAGHICKTYHATFITGSLSVLTNVKPTVTFR